MDPKTGNTGTIATSAASIRSLLRRSIDGVDLEVVWAHTGSSMHLLRPGAKLSFHKSQVHDGKVAMCGCPAYSAKQRIKLEGARHALSPGQQYDELTVLVEITAMKLCTNCLGAARKWVRLHPPAPDVARILEARRGLAAIAAR